MAHILTSMAQSHDSRIKCTNQPRIKHLNIILCTFRSTITLVCNRRPRSSFTSPEVESSVPTHCQGRSELPGCAGAESCPWATSWTNGQLHVWCFDVKKVPFLMRLAVTILPSSAPDCHVHLRFWWVAVKSVTTLACDMRQVIESLHVSKCGACTFICTWQFNYFSICPLADINRVPLHMSVQLLFTMSKK